MMFRAGAYYRSQSGIVTRCIECDNDTVTFDRLLNDLLIDRGQFYAPITYDLKAFEEPLRTRYKLPILTLVYVSESINIQFVSKPDRK